MTEKPEKSWLAKQFENKAKRRTYWNGERTPCTVVRVIVGKAPDGWWCVGLEGTEREAVRVETKTSRFYLDNDSFDGSDRGNAWAKVTLGRGSPRYGHRSLPVEREVEA